MTTSNQEPAATLVESFRDVRRCSTPIIAVSTSDQPGAISRLSDVNGGAVFTWDAVRGLRAVGQEAAAALNAMLGGADPEMTIDPVNALEVLEGSPEGAMAFLINSHCFVSDGRVSTGVGNLRDRFKSNGCTLVLLGPGFEALPAELIPDVVQLRDPLPSDDDLGDLVDRLGDDLENSGTTLQEIGALDRAGAVNALRGLSAFNAEQQLYMALQPAEGVDGLCLDLPRLWSRKVEAVSNIPGLTMSYESRERGSVHGLDALLAFYDKLFRPENPNRPAVVLHVDEVDKGMAGTGGGQGPGDSSGVAQDQLNCFLQTMEGKGWNGIIPVGPPGTGKTLVSETLAGIYGIPYVRLDLGALKGSLVGESEQKIRAALEAVDRIGGGKVWIQATCNRLDSIPAELKRRFKRGIWYFDLPDVDGQRALWAHFAEKFQIAELLDDPAGAPIEPGLTGADIRNICENVADLGGTLAEARDLVVPVYRADPDSIDKLRRIAAGAFLDASTGGTYTGPAVVENSAPTGRRIPQGAN